MSIKVDLPGLGAAMADHDYAYLLSPGRPAGAAATAGRWTSRAEPPVDASEI